jgi:ribose transport system substrate-binding protein
VYRRKSIRAGLAAVAVAAACGLAAGCGSASSGSSSGSGQQAQAGSTGSAGTAACLAKTKVVTDEALRTPTIQLPSTPLKTAGLAGKTIWAVTLSSEVPVIQEEIAGLTKAAKTLGMNVKAFDGQGNPAQWAVGIQEAVSQHAAVIALLVIDPRSVTQSLAKAAAAGIPVVSDLALPPSEPLPKYVTAQIAPDYSQIAKIQASYILNATGCTGTYGYFYSSNLIGEALQAPVVEATFKQDCPACTLDVENQPAGATSNVFSGIAQSFVNSHKDLSGIITAGDEIADPTISGLHAIKADVKIVGGAGDEANVGYLQTGAEIGDVLWPQHEMIGYLVADESARVANGQKPVTEPFPIFLVTNKTVGSGNVWAAFDGYQQKFADFWKETG